MSTPHTCIVGLGSDSGDDRAGWLAIARVQALSPSSHAIALRSPAELLDHLTGVERLHVVDACQGAGPPGSIFRHDWPTPQLSRLTFAGTHDLSLLVALEIAERLKMLPARVTIWGIELAMSASPAQSVSAAVAQSVETCVAQLLAECANEAFPVQEVTADHA